MRFARPDILFYDAHRIDFYQLICTQYPHGLKMMKKQWKKRTLKQRAKDVQTSMRSTGYPGSKIKK